MRDASSAELDRKRLGRLLSAAFTTLSSLSGEFRQKTAVSHRRWFCLL
jgi:hypothetical protein